MKLTGALASTLLAILLYMAPAGAKQSQVQSEQTSPWDAAAQVGNTIVVSGMVLAFLNSLKK